MTHMGDEANNQTDPWQPLDSSRPASPIPPPPPGYAPVPMPHPAGHVPPPPGVNPPANGMAVASLVTGLIGICVPLLSIAAIVLGHMGLKQIKRSQGSEGGRTMAMTGLVLGYVITTLIVLGLVGFGAVLLLRQGTSEMVFEECTAEMLTIETAALAFEAANGRYPDDVNELRDEGWLNNKNLVGAYEFYDDSVVQLSCATG